MTVLEGAIEFRFAADLRNRGLRRERKTVATAVVLSEVKASRGVSTIVVRSPTMPAPGDILGHYRVKEQLGEGAFGTVFLGEDIRLGRRVAIKVPHVQSEDDPSAWAQLLAEAQAAAALNHTNICGTFDIGEEGGINYIAIEYVEGQTLSSLIHGVPLPVDLALSYAIQIAKALEHAHDHDIIHRDLKASNVMISSEGQAKLLDFGLARRLDPRMLESVSQSRQSLAEIGTTAGTLCYMAPEVLHGKAPRPASDLWSLGALLHEMLAGELPFKGETPFELTMAIMVEEPGPLPSSVPVALREVVGKCLKKEPKDRFTSAHEVLDQLEAVQASITKPNRKLLRLPAQLAVAFALVMALTGTAYIWRHHAKPASPKVEVVKTAPAVTAPATSISNKALPPTPNQKHSPVSPQTRRFAGNPNVDVWVNLKTQIYHCPGTRWYQKTADGTLLKQRQAQLKGYQPASHQVCE